MVWKRRARGAGGGSSINGSGSSSSGHTNASARGGSGSEESVQQVRVSNHARSWLVVDCLVISEAATPPFTVRHRRFELPARSFVHLPVSCDVCAKVEAAEEEQRRRCFC
mmetsp:Transcript_27859/g.89820  ORF Transcript_27859/g.89820 Transcript_27859/m.89820 type:complete len:110 (-) Transcript_27859:125-454(-)